MSRPRADRLRRGGIVGTAAVSAFSLVLVGLAAMHEGVSAAEVDLHDGGVWVTNSAENLVAHLNVEAGVLTAGLRTVGNRVDLAQDRSTVVVTDHAAAAASQIDVAQAMFGSEVELTGGAVILGGQTTAVLDESGTSLWLSNGSGLVGIDPLSVPELELPGPGVMTVGGDGAVHVALAEQGELWTIEPDGEGGFADPTVRELEGVGSDSDLTITAVGAEPVVLDGSQERLILDGTTVAVAEDAQLQQPGAPADTVLVATREGLIFQPLDGTSAREVSPETTGGRPAAPVHLNGCAYAAWNTTAQYVRDCGDPALDLALTIPGDLGLGELVFRVNRDVAVLNDARTGGVWLTDEDLTRVENWLDVSPPEDDGEGEEDGDRADSHVADMVMPERSEENSAPVAEDDEFGVRPGRTTIVPVLTNDTDPDHDVLVVTPTSEPSFGQVQSLHRGAALQISLNEDASGTTTFEYRVDDGRGGEDTATVTVRVRDWSSNEAPEQLQVPTLILEQGEDLDYRVLDDWTDPDGDEVFLQSATTGGADEVRFTPDGLVTFRDVGTTYGRKQVDLVVSDGQADAEGVLIIDVRPPGDLPPMANQDHVQTVPGREVLIQPLHNDTDPNGDQLRLARVSELPDAQVRADHDAGEIVFSSDREGVHYLVYDVTDGTHTVEGLIRVDVLPESEDPQPPVAVRDIALVPHGGETHVDVLANDVDPSGGVLVVQAVEAPEDAMVRVAVLEHRVVKVISTGVLEDPVTVDYTVANGHGSAVGQILVLPVPRPAALAPPVANDDEVIVRAGDVVDIPVLSNDFHPSGDILTVAPDLVQGPEEGLAFVAGGLVRYQAGAEEGTVHLIYEAVDSTGQSDSAQITIRVRAMDEETNAAPRPPELTARTVAGAATRIPVPLSGVDPDGDSVSLRGLDQPPSLGAITAVGRDYLEYTAHPESSGTDIFSYAVEDVLGARGTAQARVGIATPGPNQAPLAVDDYVSVQPGRLLWIDPLSNDQDPDGDELQIIENSIEVIAGDIEPELIGNRIELLVPDEPTTAVMYYSITDPSGATATASITVNVAEEAELLRPVVRDDFVDLADVSDLDDSQGQVLVQVPVLENDEDPDGRSIDLEVSLDHEGTEVDDEGVVTLALADHRQIVPYSVTDTDGLAGMAFIWLPGLVDDRRPVLRDVPPVEVESGEELLLPLEDFVRVAPGRTPRITEAASVSAVSSDGSSSVVDATTLRFVSADRYSGPASVTFEATDGTGPDDPDGRKAVLTIAITVLPNEQDEEPLETEEPSAEEDQPAAPDGSEGASAEEPTSDEVEEPANRPPQVRGATIQVAPGEGPTTLDLRTVASDPDPEDQLTFGLAAAAPAGLTANLTGSILSVSATAATAPGFQANLPITVNDGVNPPVSGTVQVVVVSSTRPLAVVNDDVVPAAAQGRAVQVPVLANDVSPFPGEPLTLIAQSAQVESGRGTAATEGSQVVVTPADDFVGTMLVSYRVADVTQDPSREVSGRILVTVQGRPDAPPTPTVTEVRSRTVVLSWSPPASNGAAITGYTVRSGSFSQQCPATTCTLEGLTNNVEYAFTVTATNSVGESPASPASAPARPDARPSAPAPPALGFGDGQVSVQWATPTGYEGSPVASFNLRISPAPPVGPASRTGVTGNSLIWDGLANGTAYRVEVQAVNRAPEPSDWSAPSASETPAGVPAQPAAPTTAMLDPVGGQAQIQVSWSPPANNGAEVSGYLLAVLRGSALERSIEVPGGTTRQAVVLPTSETGYTFMVSARNRAGVSPNSPASAPRRAVVAPGQVPNVSAVPQDRALSVTYGAAPGHGARPEEVVYQYRLNSGSWTNFGGGPGTRTISGLSNGTTYLTEVRATTTVDGQTFAGPATGAAQAVPYGPVGIPALTGTVSGNRVTFTWAPPNPNGRSIVATRWRHNGGAWNQVTGGSGTMTVGTAFGQDHRWEVQAVDSEGQVGTSATLTRSTPSPRTWVTRSGSTLTYRWENLNLPAWPEVSMFRCYNTPPMEHDGIHNIVATRAGSFSTSTGQVSMDCPGATNRYSIEPWKYGPWLQVGGTWQAHQTMSSSRTHLTERHAQ